MILEELITLIEDRRKKEKEKIDKFNKNVADGIKKNKKVAKSDWAKKASVPTSYGKGS